MIELALANRLIEQITRYTDYNINIMDEKGVIIASRDEKRVGSFHAVAFQMLQSGEEMIEVRDAAPYPGVQPGINMLLLIGGKREGVVGLTGAPEEIKSVALITKMAIEAVLNYERQQAELRKHLSQKGRFIGLLTQSEFSDPALLKRMAAELHYTETLLRIPVLCRLESRHAAHFLQILKDSSRHSKEDISFLLEDGKSVLIFKMLPEKSDSLFSDYKYLIAEYLSTALRWLREAGGTARVYVGSFQKSLAQYYYAYRHCLWLEQQAPDAESAYFYDYTGAYMRDILPAAELSRMFYPYEALLDQNFLKSFTEVSGALLASNFNFVTAASGLYIHKNTLQYRYNKIKERLGIDPVLRASDRQLMELLYCHLIKNNRL